MLIWGKFALYHKFEKVTYALGILVVMKSISFGVFDAKPKMCLDKFYINSGLNLELYPILKKAYLIIWYFFSNKALSYMPDDILLNLIIGWLPTKLVKTSKKWVWFG